MVLTIKNKQNHRNANLELINLKTGKQIVFEENFQAAISPKPVFLDKDQILYSPSTGKYVIYDIFTNSKRNFSIEQAQGSGRLISQDQGLISFIASIGNKLIFSFYNPVQKTTTSRLDFDIEASKLDGSLQLLDFGVTEVAIGTDNSLYLKDIYSYTPPITISTGSKYFSTFFTLNPRYFLYTAGTDDLTNVYRVDTKTLQNTILLKNARLPDPINSLK